MSSFENVSVVKAANIYFDGKVSSRTIEFSDGSKKTLGIMMVGDYEFDTDDNELVEIQAGEVDVLLPNCQVSPRCSLSPKITLRNISGSLINKSGFKLYQYSKAS